MKERLVLIVSVLTILIASIFIRSSREIIIPVQKENSPAVQTTPKTEEGSATQETSTEPVAPTSSPKTTTSSPKKNTPPTSLFDTIKNIFPVIHTPPTTTVVTAVVSTTTISDLPPEQPINPQSIVGILCNYKYSLEHPITHQILTGDTARKGSGVIIDPRGYIITNRHLLSWDDETEDIQVGDKNYPVTIHYTLRNCNAGRVPAGTVAPSKELIQSINPSTQVLTLAYQLEIVLTSNRYSEMSADESLFADFALMKISGISSEGASFGITSLPTSFEYAKILPLKNLNIANKEVLTYGFPGDVTVGRGSNFDTLYLTGSVGRITDVVYGTQYYNGTPLYVKTKMEIYSGRSGSPLFWRGYVIGLITAEDSTNRTNSYSVASDIILRSIREYIN